MVGVTGMRMMPLKYLASIVQTISKPKHTYKIYLPRPNSLFHARLHVGRAVGCAYEGQIAEYYAQYSLLSYSSFWRKPANELKGAPQWVKRKACPGPVKVLPVQNHHMAQIVLQDDRREWRREGRKSKEGLYPKQELGLFHAPPYMSETTTYQIFGIYMLLRKP